LNKIYNMNCLEALKKMPDKSIDLIITDPPYGKKWTRGLNSIGQSKEICFEDDKCEWDIVPEKEIFDEMFRVSKNQIIFGFNHFVENLKSSNCIIVWNKRKNYNNDGVFADGELAWTSFNKVIKIYDVVSMGFILDKSEKNYENRIHPTQKPLPLIKNIIQDFSNKDDIIMDCFMGSGTTAVACIELNRKFIGFEANKEYFDKSIIRLNKKYKNTTLNDY